MLGGLTTQKGATHEVQLSPKSKWRESTVMVTERGVGEDPTTEIRRRITALLWLTATLKGLKYSRNSSV